MSVTEESPSRQRVSSRHIRAKVIDLDRERRARAAEAHVPSNDKMEQLCQSIIVKECLIEYLIAEVGIDERCKEDFRTKLVALILDFRSGVETGLDASKLRDYRPREGVINWLRAEDGAGPWLSAGLLTKPLLFRHAPRGYNAILNFEKHSKLPDDIKIPTRSEIVDAELQAMGIDARSSEGRQRIKSLSAAARRRKPIGA